MKRQIKKILLSIFGIGVASVAVLSGNQEMRYLHSYETLAFETSDGDLALDEYLVITENTLLPLKVVQSSKIPRYTESVLYLIREVSKDKGAWIVTNELVKIANKKEVKFRCEACIYFSEFIDSNGEVYRKQISESDYNGMRYIKNFDHPRETEFVLGKKVRAAPAFDAQVTGTNTVAATSYTLAMTLGSISNPALVISSTKNALANTVTATYNSVSMTEERKLSSDVGNDREIVTFSLANPTTGSSQNIVTSFSGSTWAGIMAFSYAGVNQAAPVGAKKTHHEGSCSTTDGISTTITSSSTDSTLVDAVIVLAGSITLTEQGSLIKRAALTSCNNCGAGAIGELDAPTIQLYTLAWKPNSSEQCFHTILELQASAAAAGGGDTGNNIMIISKK